jgi:CP family cyanate transporter-like MFS transporter
VLAGVSLRGPLIAVAPVTGPLRAGLHIGAATAGLFTSIPVLLFAVAAPPALLLLRRGGLDRVVFGALVGVAAGTIIRSVGGLGVALTGTVILGLAIGVGNVAIPVAIGRDFPEQAGPMTGLYTAALNFGSMLTSLLTAPLAAVVGWRWALAAWAVLGLGAAATWRAVGRRSVRLADRAEANRPVPVEVAAEAAVEAPYDAGAPMWRRPVPLLLAVVFAGQSFSYYGLTAWLPSLLSDERGLSRAGAGLSSSLFQILGIAGALMAPVLIHRGVTRRAVFIGVCAFFVALPVGLLVAPAWWPAWCACGGLAQGGGITIIFILVLSQVGSTRDRQRVSTVVQGLGYAVGAAGPTVVGAVHQATGSWRAPMIVVVLAIAIMTVAGLVASTLVATGAERATA